MRLTRLSFVCGAAVLLSSLALFAAFSTRAQQAAGVTETGMAIKKPVVGGSCKTCPWGAIADIVKSAMQPYGWDVQVCYNCAGGAQEARIVAAAKMPPPLAPAADPKQTPPPPHGAVDFGVIRTELLWWGYQGNHDFTGEDPKKNLRLVASIQAPIYLVVGVKADLGVTDLSQLKDKGRPIRVIWDDGLHGHTASKVLAYYGLTKQSIEAAGGHVGSGANLEERKNFDVVIYIGDLSSAPEYNVLYEVSQKFDLTYPQLPDDLLNQLVKEDDMVRVTIPDGLLRGVDHAMPGVAYTGNAIYARTDTPDDFAYTLAKAMDEHQDLLQWSNQAFSYNPHTAWKAYGVPLHPGAERYYREKGYMK